MAQMRKQHARGRNALVVLAAMVALGGSATTAANAACQVSSPVLGEVSPANLERGVGQDVIFDGVDAPRRHRCAKVAVLKDRYEGGARGRG